MKYRREIDGLRAVAVLPVILFHAGVTWFSGGYVGVDVFFVISGYLITSILLKDLAEEKFSIIKFYERRAKRILPVLTLVILCCIPFAWILLLPSQFQDFSKAVVATSLFASNILFWRQSDYFAPAAEENPLLHTWSLAVEEQFYIFFPIFLLLLWRFGKNIIFYALVSVSLVSLILSEYGWRYHPSANFYLLITRAWELGAGAICAFYLFNKPLKSNDFLAILGFLLILYAIFFFDSNTPFPSLYALVPVVGSALIIIFAGARTLLAKLLSLKFFVGVGLISYSAYLWHQPIFAFARIKSFGEVAPKTMILLIVLTLFLAYLSWRFVETPFRNGRIKFFSSGRKIFISSAVSLAALFCFGLYGHLSQGAEWRNVGIQAYSYEPDNKKLQLESWGILKDITGSKTYSVSENEVDQKLWFYGADFGVKLLVVGNSHSKDIFNVIYNSKYLNEDVSVARYGAQVFQLADRNHEFYNSENFLASDVVIIASRYRYEDVEVLEGVIDNMEAFGKKVVLTKNIFEFPEFGGGRNLADFVLHQLDGEKNLVAETSAVSNIVNERHYSVYISGETDGKVIEANKKIDSMKGKILVLNRMDYVCSSEVKKCFSINDRYEKYFYDYGHHTLAGARFFGSRLKNIGWLDALLRGHNSIAARER